MAFRHFALAAALLLCTLTALAGEFSEFRIPTHRVFNLGLGLSGGWNDRTQSQNYGYTGRSSNEQLYGQFHVPAFWLYDSEPRYLRLDVSANVAADRSRGEHSDQYTAEIDNRRRTLREQLFLNAAWREYPWQTPVAILASGTSYLSWQQGWQTQDVSNPEVSSSRAEDEWDYNYSVIAEAGVGYGRVRDATGVIMAQVFEDRMRAAGAIDGPLPQTARRDLAALFYREDDFFRTHQRASKYFWQEIERILRDNGVALAEFSAWDWMRAAESFVGESLQRPIGWNVALVARERHENHVSRWNSTVSTVTELTDTTLYSHSRSYERGSWTKDQFAPGVRAEAHWPVNWRMQLDARAAAYLPVNDAAHAFDVQAAVSAGYVLADRWLLTGELNYGRAIERTGFHGAHWPRSMSHLNNIYYFSFPRRSGPDYDLWSTLAGATVSYFIEDHLSIDLQGTQRQARDAGVPFYYRDSQVWIGVSYRLIGNPSISHSRWN